MANYYIHRTADVSKKSKIGKGTKIWHQAQIREGAEIGENVIIGKNVYIDRNVKIGSNVKIQNNASIYHGVTLEDGVFIGPHVCLTNDKIPRAINTNNELKRTDEWSVDITTIKKGASIGAGSVLLPGITIGKFTMIGAGSLVTKEVPDHALVLGNPARQVGFVCYCGSVLVEKDSEFLCEVCKITIKV